MSLTLICGPMFSGKTSELRRIYRRNKIAKKKCIIIRFDEDTRYSTDSISTHDNIHETAIGTSKLYDIKHLCDDIDCIFIDEIQFYEDCVEFCEEMANDDKEIYASGLNGDFRREPFSYNMSKLLANADFIIHLTAICVHCGGPASFTHRLTDCKDKKEIGGLGKYEAVCRKCYINLNE